MVSDANPQELPELSDREAFEDAIERIYSNCLLGVEANGDYVSAQTQRFWMLWCAAQASPQEPVGEVEYIEGLACIKFYENGREAPDNGTKLYASPAATGASSRAAEWREWVSASDVECRAQHDETTRTWEGPLGELPRRFAPFLLRLAATGASSRAAEGQDDSDLVERAVRNARLPSGTKWAAVMYVFGFGSTRSKALCVRFGFNPDDSAETAISAQPWGVSPPSTARVNADLVASLEALLVQAKAEGWQHVSIAEMERVLHPQPISKGA